MAVGSASETAVDSDVAGGIPVLPSRDGVGGGEVGTAVRVGSSVGVGGTGVAVGSGMGLDGTGVGVTDTSSPRIIVSGEAAVRPAASRNWTYTVCSPGVSGKVQGTSGSHGCHGMFSKSGSLLIRISIARPMKTTPSPPGRASSFVNRIAT